MKRSEMVCRNCIKGTDQLSHEGRKTGWVECRLVPEVRAKQGQGWCAQGEWSEWSEKYKEWIPYYWGEFDKEPPCPKS